MRASLAFALTAAAAGALAGCGDDHHRTTGDDDDGDGGVPADGVVSSCDPPGHFGGAPALTFVLPPTGTGFNYPDVQAALPQVDWANLDRLYIPAGQYTNLLIGNLPVRTAEHPLVITNHGGQVVVGFNPTGNYIWSINGGAHWILTGRADAESETGDAAFPGHACGHYAESAGHYGFTSDDDYAFSAPYLHMGIAVGGGATDFEIEYVEVKRSGFAGIRLLNDPATTAPMRDVRVHDVYIHDTGGEGFYFGWTGTPPSNLLPGLQIYNCRILRTGNEALQIQDLGDGTHVHHNTFISGGLHWLDNGLGRYQDSNTQISTREGTIEFDHNVFIDGAGTLISFFSAPQGSDGARHVTFHDNYLAAAIDLGMYLNGMSTAGSSFTWDHNVFRAFQFAYTPADPNAQNPNVVTGVNPPNMAPIAFTNNHWDGVDRIVSGITGGDGTAGNITASGNVHADPGAITLLDGPWTTPGHHLTAWAPNATVVSGSPAVTYHAGDVVTHGDAPDLFAATADTTVAPPGAGWTAVPAPTDDVRVMPGSAYAGFGVQ